MATNAIRIVWESDPIGDASYLEQEGFEDRLADYQAGRFWHVCCHAKVDVIVAGTVQTLRSGGLHGIESDSDQQHLEGIAAEERASLVGILAELGIR